MDVERIGFIPTVSRYEVLWVFLQELKESMCTLPKIQGHIFSLDTTPEQFLREFSQFKPQLLIAFNSLFAQPDGRLLCDFLKVPTLFYLVDSLFHFDVHASPYAWMSCIDRGQLRFLTKRGIKNTLFLPHAISKVDEISPGPRPYDIVMVSSGIDYQTHHNKLFAALSLKGKKVIEEGLERWEADRNLTLDEALDEEIPSHLPRNFILRKLDLYLKGLKRVELLKQLKDFPIDLYGGGDSWQHILGDTCPHVTFRGEMSFETAITLFSKAKVVLNSCSSIRDGAHERIFQALSHGAAVATDRTQYMMENFKEGEGVAYFPDYKTLGKKIAFWLENEPARQAEVEAGRLKVAAGQLWKHRAETIYRTLSQS